MTASFTPGPWWVDDAPVALLIRTQLDGDVDDDTGQHLIVGGDIVAQIEDIDEAEANARLIAAAPDLYAALEHILNGASALPHFAEEQGRAALASVDGRRMAETAQTGSVPQGTTSAVANGETPTPSPVTGEGQGERRCKHGIRHPWQCDDCDRENPMPPAQPEVNQ